MPSCLSLRKWAQMTHFVLDNSVAMRWIIESDKQSGQEYAESVLKSLSNADAHVPNLWHLEASNVLLGATTKGPKGPELLICNMIRGMNRAYPVVAHIY